MARRELQGRGLHRGADPHGGIYEYLDGVLTGEDIDEIHGHLLECPECAREYDLECIIRTVVRRSCAERAPQT